MRLVATTADKMRARFTAISQRVLRGTTGFAASGSRQFLAAALALLWAGCSDPCEPLDCPDPGACWALAEGPSATPGPHFVATLSFPALERLGSDRIRATLKPVLDATPSGDGRVILRSRPGPLSLSREDGQLLAHSPLVLEVGHVAGSARPGDLTIEDRRGGLITWPVELRLGSNPAHLQVVAAGEPRIRLPEQWSGPEADHESLAAMADKAGRQWAARLSSLDVLKLTPSPALRTATWAVHTDERSVALAATPDPPPPGPALDPLARDQRPGVRQDLTQTASWGLLQAATRAGPPIEGYAVQPLLLARDSVPRVVLRARRPDRCGLADAEIMLAAGKPDHTLSLTPTGPPRLLQAVGDTNSFDPRWAEPALQRLAAASAPAVVRGIGPERFAPLMNRPLPAGLARDFRVPRRLPFTRPATLRPTDHPMSRPPPPEKPPASPRAPPPAPPASGQ